jgi:AcrR family transcriptional regulator
MQSARRLYETRGVAASSITAIAQEAKTTRSLVYYYFPDKDAITAAVLDDYVEDLVDSVGIWNEFRVFGDTPAEVQKCIAAFRRALYDATGKERPMIGVLDELGIRQEFDLRAVRATVDCINHDTVAEYAAYHQIEIEYVYEMFCMVVFGLVGLMKLEPAITDEALATIVAQALHLDMRVIEPPRGIKRERA